MVDRMLPEAALALERLARAAGFDVGFPKGQWCCGLIAANAGDFEGGYKLNTSLVECLRDSKGPVVTPSASCFGAFTIDALEWGPQDGASDLRSRFRDSTRFALELIAAQPDLVRPATDRQRIAYLILQHAPREYTEFRHLAAHSVAVHVGDHLRRGDVLGRCGNSGNATTPHLHMGFLSSIEPITTRPMRLAGYEVIEIPDIANCCGFGGTFSVEWPAVAGRLADWKLDAIAKTGCSVVASDNPGCLVHIGAAARRRRRPLRIAHVLELVADRLEPTAWAAR